MIRCTQRHLAPVSAGRCRRCITAQSEQGVTDDDMKHSVYLGESSRSLPSRSAFHFRDYTQEMKKKIVVEKWTSRDEEGTGGRGERVRRGSEDEEEEGGVPVSVSSWMADHSRECHGGVISTNPMMDYEFEVTGTFLKPLHRQGEIALTES